MINEWCGKYNDGDEPSKARVVKWYTNASSSRKLSTAVLAFVNGIADGSLSHDGHEGLARHVANAQKRPIGTKDEKGQPMWTIQKERPDSPKKIDAAMAAILSWQARQDARALGIGTVEASPYETRGFLSL